MSTDATTPTGTIPPVSIPPTGHGRRQFFDRMSTGLAGVALSQLLGNRRVLAATRADGTPLDYEPKAKRVLQIFCPGAVSHMDTWEYKPALGRYNGKPLPGSTEKIVTFMGENGNLMKSPWKFVRRGQCGKPISELFPELGGFVDDIAFVHSLHSKTNTHGPGCVFMNSGFETEGFPSAGSWVSYALGSDNDNLPTYVVIPDVRGIPPSGPANWNAGFLPAEHQAIVLGASEPIKNLDRPGGIDAKADAAAREFVLFANRRHAKRHPGNPGLQARIASYELAARMQLSAPEASDLASEPASIHQLYGTEDSNKLLAAYARNCLLARRLLERGVRYVTLYCGSRASGVDGLLNWDAHKTLKQDYERHAPILDKPTAGLLKDLRSRGLLDETLILWTTEFGRMPTHQKGTLGRDHNPGGFTAWMMGAGVQGGVSYGATDQFGLKAEENVATVWDFYATVLYLLGLDHEKATYYHNGIERRLTDVHGHVIRDVLA
jgi:hypothetical protein